jgi:hypothetical protein
LDLTAEGEKVAVVIMDLSIGGVEVAPGGGTRSCLPMWISPREEVTSVAMDRSIERE